MLAWKKQTINIDDDDDDDHHHPGKNVGWGNGIKGMVQNRPTIYRVVNLDERGFMEGRDEF